MTNIDFTCTCVAQKYELLYQTIESLRSNLIGIDFSKSTIYVNIDQSPEKDSNNNVRKTVGYLNEVFGRVVANIPAEPNFAKAVQWCWSQPQSEFFFHTEDDWILDKKVNLDTMMEYFNNPSMASVNLRAYTFKNPRLCLLQSLWRKKFCDQFLKHYNFDYNPENQLRAFGKITRFDNIHYPEDVEEIIVKDIGRPWLISQGIKRNHMSSSFIKYTRS